jgi:tRNA U34 5-carboxymethylaminomethyl modifying enzyme MnmG/GidA
MLAREQALELPSTLWPCTQAEWAQALKLEVREKLDAARPPTLSAAGQLQGVTPAALVALRLRARLEGARNHTVPTTATN